MLECLFRRCTHKHTHTHADKITWDALSLIVVPVFRRFSISSVEIRGERHERKAGADFASLEVGVKLRKYFFCGRGASTFRYSRVKPEKEYSSRFK